MAKTMTPSEGISSGQIGQIQDRLGTALRTSGLQSDPVQQVLSTKGQGDLMIAGMVAVVRKFAEAKAKEIVRRVKVDRTLTPMEVIDATGRAKYVDKKIVETMPKGEGEEVDFVLFKPEPEEYTRPGFMSDDDLDKALDRRGLIYDPRAQTKVNEYDPALADERPNGTHWKEGDHYNFVTFYRWSGERNVYVNRSSDGWDVSWWFGGVRK
jgi:hypothetical protein